MRELYVIAHDMRSAFNVGSLFRTAEGLGVKKLYLTGYTPHPRFEGDTRLPHVIDKITEQIDKTALGAAQTLDWEYAEDVTDVIRQLTAKGITVAALEQTRQAIEITAYEAPNELALVLGTEVTGLPDDILELVHDHIVIPMLGTKESFNVVQAAAMALFEFRFH